MAKKAEKQITSPEEIEVKLTPFLGMQPGTYLTVLYTIIFLIIIFLVLFLPGIRKYGTRLTVYTVPGQTDVYIDGEYAGAAPLEVFVPAGEHTFTLRKSFYETKKLTETIGGRLFGSLIFPKRDIIPAGLSLVDPEGYASRTYSEFSSWSLIRDPHERYQIPHVLSETVTDLIAAENEAALRTGDRLVTASLGFSSGETGLRDILKASVLLETEGKPLLPQSIIALTARIAELQHERPGFGLWLAEQLGDSASARIQDTEWYAASVLGLSDNPLESAPVLPADDVLYLSGIPFRYVAAGTKRVALSEEDSGSFVLFSHSGFYSMPREVTCRDYALFINENSEWSPSNKEELIARGVVTEEYLTDWDERKGSDYPVRYVSYYAAEAFCEWIGSKISSEGTMSAGWKADLPNEYQWEIAAEISVMNQPVLFRKGADGPQPPRGESVFTDFYGNLWEWCRNDYKPNDAVSFSRGGVYLEPPDGYFGAEKAVRGGSWASIEELVSIYSRGSQPPSWCTPFLGFRVVLQETQ